MRYQYDVIVSHAHEDKEPVVNELVRSLQKQGLKVWYSGAEIGIGKDITNAINKAITQSAHAIVVLSHHYLEEGWALNELNAIIDLETDKKINLLPLRYNIHPREVREKHPIIGARYGYQIEKDIDELARRISLQIRDSFTGEIIPLPVTVKSLPIKEYQQKNQFLYYLIPFLLIGLCTLLLWFFFANSKYSPDYSQSKALVIEHIEDFQKYISDQSSADIARHKAVPVSAETARRFYMLLAKTANNPALEVNSPSGKHTNKKEISDLGFHIHENAIYNNFGLSSCSYYLSGDTLKQEDITIFLLNNKPVLAEFENLTRLNDHQQSIKVHYEQPLQAITISKQPEHGYLIRFSGFADKEEYVLEKKQDQWIITGIK